MAYPKVRFGRRHFLCQEFQNGVELIFEGKGWAPNPNPCYLEVKTWGGVGWVEVSKYPKLKLGVVHVRLLDQIVSTTEINPNLAHLLNGLGMSTKTLNYQSLGPGQVRTCHP